MRIGNGVDIHKLSAEVPCHLAGLYFPDTPGCMGHSDGDVAIHAICDALLAAAQLGDLGQWFGTAASEYKNAKSTVFLKKVVAEVQEAGFEIENVTVQIIANQPKLADRRKEAQSLLEDIVEAPVSVAATTADGLGITGTGKGIAAYAVALLK